MSDGGKGSTQRPTDPKKFGDGFDRIFGKKPDGCKRCNGNMVDGVAIAQTYTGTPDFPGDDHCVTMSPGGPGSLVECRKCDKCGWSVTK